MSKENFQDQAPELDNIKSRNATDLFGQNRTVLSPLSVRANTNLSRRDFLKIAGVGLGAMAFRPPKSLDNDPLTQTEVDLLKQPGWEFMPGTRGENTSLEGLHIHPVHSKLRINKGTDDNPQMEDVRNYPVNLFGAHLENINGDYEITVQLENIKDSAVFQIYEKPPVIKDERMEMPRSIRLNLENGMVYGDIWNGRRSHEVDRTFEDNAEIINGSAEIKIQQVGGRIRILVNGKEVNTSEAGELPEFTSLWFGLDSDTSVDNLENGSFRVKGLNISKLEGGSFNIVNLLDYKHDKSPEGFQALAENITISQENKILLGTSVTPESLAESEELRKMVIENFGIITLENTMKMQHLQPTEGEFVFGPADAVVEMASRNGLKVHGHTLVFGEGLPDWVRAESDPMRIKEIMINHVKTVIKHYAEKYPNTIVSWDVVNEPMELVNNVREKNKWHEAMGEEYISIAMNAAREALEEVAQIPGHEDDIKPLLGINEFGLDSTDNARWKEFINLITRLKDRNVQIDFVGFQGHVFGEGDEIDPSRLLKRSAELREMNILTRMSELSVYGTNSGNTEEKQAYQYGTALIAGLNCGSLSVTAWGLGSPGKYFFTSYPEWGDGDDAMTDGNFNKKEAWQKWLYILSTWSREEGRR